jgi:hypothetical protein
VLALALAGSGLAASTAAAATTNQPIISATIYNTHGTSTESALETYLEDGSCPEDAGPVTVEGSGPEYFSTNPTSGSWALSTLLGCLTPPISISGVTGLTVLTEDGSAEHELAPDDLASPSDFDGGEQPIVSFNGDAVQYDRPQRNPGDNNQPDQVVEDPGQPLSVEVFEGQPLTVVASPSTYTITPGGTVNFTASETPAATGLSWTWSFDDGQTSTAQNPQAVVFPNPGNFNVIVQVTDSAGGAGQATVPILVQKPGVQVTPVTGKHPHPGVGKARNGSPHGPIGSGGAAPGAAPGTKTTTNGNNGKSGSNGTSGKNKSGGHNANAASTGGSHKQKTSSNGNGTKSNHSSSTTKHHSATSVNAPHKPVPSSSSPRQPVDGLLVSDVNPVPPGASPLVHVLAPPLATATPLRSAVSAPVLPIVGAAAAVVLLLTLGAARELRGRRAWRTLRLGS